MADTSTTQDSAFYMEGMPRHFTDKDEPGTKKDTTR